MVSCGVSCCRILSARILPTRAPSVIPAKYVPRGRHARFICDPGASLVCMQSTICCHPHESDECCREGVKVRLTGS
eukprot:scaffold5944_cov101-Amphora_coffeaeformis.AAC.6